MSKHMQHTTQLPAIAYQVSFLKRHWKEQRTYRLNMYTMVIRSIGTRTMKYVVREFVDFVEYDVRSPIWRTFWLEQGRLAYIIAALRVVYHFAPTLSAQCGDTIWRLKRLSVDESE